MTDAELFAFTDVCKDLMRVFPKRLEEFEKAQLHRDYFKALRRFSVSQVQAGAEAWMQRGKYFPKPAEWIDSIPKQAPTALVDVPAMSPMEAREYQRAERLRYEDQPCGCRDCVAAQVSEKPVRFVPEFTADDRERKVRDGERIVTAGHWAHGTELARYYKAKADFYEAYYKALAKKGMR